MMKIRPLFLLALLLAGTSLTLATGILGWALYLQATGNFHTIEPEYAYRSDTLGADHLRAIAATYGIRTIINLRGPSPGESWYDSEKAVADNLHVPMINIAMRDDEVPSPQTLDALLVALKDAPRPCSSSASQALIERDWHRRCLSTR